MGTLKDAKEFLEQLPGRINKLLDLMAKTSFVFAWMPSTNAS